MILLAAGLFSGVARGQDATDRKIVKGWILQEGDSLPISNVHVVNLSRAWGTTSSYDGSFSMRLGPDDRIMFRAVGFYTDTLEFTVNKLAGLDSLVIFLRPQIYELPMVDVYPYATFTEFKYAFLNFKDPEPPIDLRLPDPLSIPSSSDGQGGIVIPGPITYLYDRFSRRGKELARYHQVLAQQDVERRAARVVNVELVKRYTGLKDDREVYDFLEYCNITPEFVLSRKEYEVYQALLVCYEQYCLEK